MRKTVDRVCSAVLVLAVALLIVTASIGLPIYIRPFYYVQIYLWDLPGQTGHSGADIQAAYDEVLDYLTLPNQPFGTGVFAYSEEGKSHFEDCKVLFDLNAAVLVISALIVAALTLLARKGYVRMVRPFGLRPSALAGGIVLGVFGLLAVLVMLNFDVAFEVFHMLLFPGKDNWLFDPRTDEIITALPIEFFASCAALIGVSALAASLSLLMRGVKEKRQRLTDQ